ncbi:hypothetical protein LIER_43739 [Lithospermum erythrorhizon]|uniref:Uncharacterized protein n=1 Tax=Lithospermum erythrorhizon TaxID=34254 RepID=A0AAV3QPD9_LITER
MPPQVVEKYLLLVEINEWKLRYEAVKAIKKSAHKNIVLVEVKHLWNCLLERSLNFPGVDGKSSSSIGCIFLDIVDNQFGEICAGGRGGGGGGCGEVWRRKKVKFKII